MIKKFTRFQFSHFTFPLIAALIFLACFGLFINQFGFFWDDWVQLLSKHLYGYASYMAYFGERPLSGWTHIVFGPLMGDSNVRWELFTLFLRWACVVTAWGLFQSIWPHHTKSAALAALLFALYPGFTQQPISVAYHQHWLEYLLFLLSLFFMVLGQRHPKYRLIYLPAALVCQALQLSITEFFVGVEMLRPLILWILIYNPSHESGQPLSRRKTLLKTLWAWLPYLAVFVAYAIWRGFIMPMSPQNQNAPSLFGSLFSHPGTTILSLFNFVTTDTLNSLLVVWGKVFDLRLTSANQPVIWLSWIFSLLLAGGLGFYLVKLKKGADEWEIYPKSVQAEMIGLGMLGVLAGPAPLWLANKNILWAMSDDIYHSDRFTLAAMLWAGLLIVGLLNWLVERWRAKALIVAALLGLLTGFQIRNANDYRWLAVDQKHFYWQLSWRAPSIQPGTAFITEDILFPYQGLFSTASALNLLYPQPKNPDLVAYWMYSLKPRFDVNSPGAPYASFDTHQRLYHFVGQTPNSLLLVYDAPKSNCLWVLRPEDQDFPDLSPLQKKWTAVSTLSRISQQHPDLSYPSMQLFGPEPEHGWCYFYEKADLARQVDDWPTAAALGDQAQAKGFSPQTSGSNNVFEWMPFIEAYAHQDRWMDAVSLIQSSIKFDPTYAPFICQRWSLLNQKIGNGSGHGEAEQKVIQLAKCAPQQ